MITIENSVFNAQGADKKAQVFGLTLNGAEDVLVKGCEFKNMGYSAVMNHCTGSVTVEDCKFDCKNIYNPIEGSQKVDNGNLTVKNCEFEGAPGNNFVNFYQFADGSHHEVVGCTFTGDTNNNIIRISNRTNATMDLLVKDCAYDYMNGTADEYTGFIMCQDYTNGQDFTKVTVTVDNVKCNGEKIVDAPAVGALHYTYKNGVGIVEDNAPVVVVK